MALWEGWIGASSGNSVMPLLSDYARKKKTEWFFRDIAPDARVLEVGSGSGWVRTYARQQGWTGYVGLDMAPPADVVGDIRDWRTLGLTEASFDVVIAFEVVEHVACFHEFYDLLVPGGLLMLTSPVPHMDWMCRILEALGLNQKRTSAHDHLVYFEKVPLFEPIAIRTVGFMAQWGKFRKPMVQPTGT